MMMMIFFICDCTLPTDAWRRQLVCLYVQLDVVVADLDGGSVRLPENVYVSLMPEPFLSRMLLCLRSVSVSVFPGFFYLLFVKTVFLCVSSITSDDDVFLFTDMTSVYHPSLQWAHFKIVIS